jgi:hypothetical protein
MESTGQILFNIVTSVALFGAGFIVKALWDAVQGLRADMASLERNLPTVYMRREDLQSVFKDIRDRLADIQHWQVRIESKLDHKADKS